MHTPLLGLVVLFLLVHGCNSIVLKLVADIKSGLEYWRETAKR